MPSTRVDFWKNKFDRTIKRDQTILEQLYASGWEVKILWECQIKEMIDIQEMCVSFLGPPKV